MFQDPTVIRRTPASGLLDQQDSSRVELITAADGLKLSWRIWHAGPASPVLLYLHGIEGHGAWFSKTATYLCNQGITVYAPDRRGSGISEGSRGHIDSFSKWTSDVEQSLIKIRELHPTEPLFLTGSCWGAKLALSALERPALKSLSISGLVLISPAISVSIDVSPMTKLAAGLSWLTGSKRLFPLPITADMFTDDPAYISLIEQDSLRLTEVTASFLAENLKLSKLAANSPNHLTLPLLVLQSGRDRIVNVSGIESWFNQVAAEDKQMFVFSWSQHSLDFDQHWAEYARCLGEWLFAQAGKQQ